MRGAAPHAPYRAHPQAAVANPQPRSARFPTRQASLGPAFLALDPQASVVRICFRLIANAVALTSKCRTLRLKIKRRFTENSNIC